MKERKQKRYETRFEIELAINAAKRKILEIERQAAEQETMRRECMDKAHAKDTPDKDRGWLMEQADKHKTDAEKLWLQSQRLTENRLKKLGDALAAFQTQTFDFITDKGVVLT